MTQILGLLLFTMATTFTYADAPPTVGELDINRYQGLWHQVAFIPNSFQKKCVSSVTAEYTLTERNKIKVVNRCLEEDGEVSVAEGRARINPKYGESSKLQVTFVKIFRWIWPFGGDYWVLDIDEDYQKVIVGHPKRKYLWILSRKAELSNRTLIQLRNKIKTTGYDPCSVQLSQPNFRYGTSLCELRADQLSALKDSL